jgi:hypothetical protein
MDDCIRQSLIDIIGEPPPEDELIPVFQAGFHLLTTPIPRPTSQNLASLLNRIYAKAGALNQSFT